MGRSTGNKQRAGRIYGGQYTNSGSSSRTSGRRRVFDIFRSSPNPANSEKTTQPESDVVGRASAAISEGLLGPLANDMPYTPYTDATLRRLADLEPRTLALMHGSTFHGDGRRAISDLAGVIQEKIG